jgi:hypothetical protein
VHRSEGGRWESQVSAWRLSHADSFRTQEIWKREVRRQQVHVDAVVSMLDANPTTIQGCPQGPVLRVVIHGTFPAEPASREYEDLYASRDGHVCAKTYRRSAPRLEGVPNGYLQRTYVVPDSS